MGAPEPSRSRTLLAYCDDVMRCMCATGSTLGPADDPLEPLELPGMLELLPVDAGGLPVDAGGLPVVVPESPILPVQPAPAAIKPAKEAPMKSRDDSCVTRFTSVDRASSTRPATPR